MCKYEFLTVYEKQNFMVNGRCDNRFELSLNISLFSLDILTSTSKPLKGLFRQSSIIFWSQQTNPKYLEPNHLFPHFLGGLLTNFQVKIEERLATSDVEPTRDSP